ncbi:hypothetical protein RclHR1_06820008 [Rhizophagus clarus]|uniref:Protein kinase domain-containing protein n=1 Tax=Rhizophagus clarus TaxID=94130 RepID=A0A2Z6SJY0_9GLOM|nr:hypothetical protein RclHR1_06820008 [Rhizophagus clarus]
MENNDNFRPTRLISSFIPISFIPFNKNKDNCDCGNKYSKTLYFNQKYCRNCLSEYVKNENNIVSHLKDQLPNFDLKTWIRIDVIIYTDNSIQYNKHDNLYKHNIQEFREWCEDSSKILYFKQIVSDYLTSSHIDDNCKLCGKVIDQHVLLCSDCYRISSRWIKSNSSENSALIIYLPWWDTYDQCITCGSQLEFTSDCQKRCLYCYIFYIGCRYCLTTNIVFGFADQSQCKKCGRTLSIITNVTGIKECFLTQDHINQIAHYINNVDKDYNPLEIYDYIKSLPIKISIDWILHSQTINSESDNENSFNLAMPIIFIPFNNEEEKCYYCKRLYSQTLSLEQKYCKYCLFIYIKYTENINIDVRIYTKNTQCDKHELRTLGFRTQNIQEWCNYCSEILYFRQIVTNYLFNIMNYDQEINRNNYSQFFFESLESTLIKRPIPVLYLPWWDAYYQCLICNSQLELKSNCQKWCLNCFIIYVGCRYCLTTNIIFGITNQSPIYIKDKFNYSASKLNINWIPYSQISNLEKIAEGGFGIIHKALIDEKVVAVKEILNSQNPSNYFLNEVTSLYQCYDEKFEYIIRCHGITKNPITDNFMFIMKFANGGNLNNYLHNNFTEITWKEKLYILWRIADGLQTIHDKGFVHRDFHSGNILIDIIKNGSHKVVQYLIGDLGLSQLANNTSSNNKIYGYGYDYVGVNSSPFANIEHDTHFIYEIIDGKRPEITNDIPEEFAYLMKKCWNSVPEKRPSAKKICGTINHWLSTKDDEKIFNQAEEIRLELIKSKVIGPEFSEPRHSQENYTSKPSVDSSKMISFNMKQEYITKEYELDIEKIQKYE